MSWIGRSLTWQTEKNMAQKPWIEQALEWHGLPMHVTWPQPPSSAEATSEFLYWTLRKCAETICIILYKYHMYMTSPLSQLTTALSFVELTKHLWSKILDSMVGGLRPPGGQLHFRVPRKKIVGETDTYIMCWFSLTLTFSQPEKLSEFIDNHLTTGFTLKP